MKRFSNLLMAGALLLLFPIMLISQPIITAPEPNTSQERDRNGFEYITYENDPWGVRIYTLENGLKVYMSVNDSEPRIQTYIAVRVGSKNDPKETTGLAHYFEHMMFKGTHKIGTIDWKREKELIQKIEDLYEVYIRETDPEERNKIYKEIDKVSYEASKLAIPNEYDKLMKLIGATGTNAATSNDFTYYQENIPSNQLENWAKVQADRFQNPVLRLFHTELETVYEEKNMSLTNDARKSNEAMLAALYPNHPYGQQTTLGSSEHLRNPSMVAINKFFDIYYVPNNYCISISGDFDPEEAIMIINKEFGEIQPKPIEPFRFEYEKPIEEVKRVDVVGLEAENLRIAFRINSGQTSYEAMLADLISSVLYNGKSGMLDNNINKKQLTLGSYAYTYGMNDYTSVILGGSPKTGQTLEDVEKLLLEQIDLFKTGGWDDALLEATINNYRLSQLRSLESNSSRAMLMARSYLANQDWADRVNELKRLSTISKSELVEFGRELFKDNNYVVVYKRQGTPDEIEKVDKPPITPIHINREEKSEFFTMIEENKAEDIQPVFLDFEKDITRIPLRNSSEILYVKNVENETFNMNIRYDMGKLHNKRLGLLASYINYLGTDSMSPEDISSEFYKLACSYSMRVGDDYTTISLSGLSENFERALELLENLLDNARPNKEALDNLIENTLKSREDSKLRQNTILSALQSYAIYGKNNPFKDIISEKELRKLKPELLIEDLRALSRYYHRIFYYGDMDEAKLKEVITTKHKTAKKLMNPPRIERFKQLETKESKVYFVHYDAKQSYCRQLTRGDRYNKELRPNIAMYNQYFGGSMNSIVFQEMREKRSLAYQAYSRYSTPSLPENHYINISHIATQNDKVIDAFDAFNELFDDMPIAEQNFELAKDGIISGIRTNRITKMGILNSYIASERMGEKDDGREELFNNIPKMTLEDVQEFNKNYIKDKPRIYIVLGHKDQVDLKGLEKYGKVETLDLEEVFGY